MRRTIFTGLSSLALVAIFAILMGCEGEPDRSLSINAFVPVNQTNDSSNPAMQGVTKIRLGIFEKSGVDYKKVKVYQFNEEDLGGEITLDDMPKSSETPYTYVLEAFGNGRMRDWVYCDINSTDSCSKGWTCYSDNTLRQQYCVRDSDEHLIARGVSSPTIYGGDEKEDLNIYFSRVGETGQLADSSGEASVMNSKHYKHASIKLPNGKVLIIGGSIWTAAGGAFVNQVELFNPDTNKFEVVYDPSDQPSDSWPLEGWATSVDYALAVLDDNELPYDTEFNTATEAKPFKFAFVGGSVARGEVINSIFIGTYDEENEVVSIEKVSSAAFTPVTLATATYIGDGKVVIVGGKTSNGSPSSDIYLLDTEDGTVGKLDVSLGTARYAHTATLLPPGTDGEIKIIVVGGWTTANTKIVTTQKVEVISINQDTYSTSVSEYEYLDTSAGEAENQADRVGHIAVPLLVRQDNGRVPPEDAGLSRVAIFGGFRKATSDKENISIYNDTTTQPEIPIAMISPDGSVFVDYWTPNAAYTSRASKSNHLTVDSQWTWLGDGYDTIVVTGGKRKFTASADSEYSDWVEIITFNYEDELWTMSTLEIGSEEADKVNAPYFITNMSSDESKSTEGRWGHSIVRLDNGMILIAGGLQAIVSGNFSTTDTAVIFNPPAYRNSWGSEFWAVSNYTNRL